MSIKGLASVHVVVQVYHMCSSSSILMWDQTGAKVLAVIIPLAAAAGTPMPGCVESPHLQQLTDHCHDSLLLQ